MITWEYWIEENECFSADELNAFGSKGWELIAITFDPTVHANQAYTYFFKRKPQKVSDSE